MKYKTIILSLLILLGLSDRIRAQVRVSGLADFVITNSEEKDYTNTTFRRFSNFHTSRTRLFFDGVVGQNTYLFAQILVDTYDFQLFAAYARFSNLAGPYFNIQVGLIPTTVGSFGERTYSDKNPLIGTPLVYNFHSALNPQKLGASPSPTDLQQSRNERSPSGIPVIYDACWNTGVEFYGSAGKFDYSLAVLTGSLSKPTQQQSKDTPQLTTHFIYNFEPGLKLGASAYIGAYLFENVFNVPTPIDESDYLNGGIGYELYFARRYLEIYSEGFYTFWEYPGLPDLKTLSGYIEAKYKLRPRWYVAGRFGLFEPNEIKFAPGVFEKWDYPVKRYEAGLGYKVLRRTTLKLVVQLNRFDINDTFDSDLYALQLSTLFN